MQLVWWIDHTKLDIITWFCQLHLPRPHYNFRVLSCTLNTKGSHIDFRSVRFLPHRNRILKAQLYHIKLERTNTSKQAALLKRSPGRQKLYFFLLVQTTLPVLQLETTTSIKHFPQNPFPRRVCGLSSC